MFPIYDRPRFPWLEDIGAVMGNSVLESLIGRGPFRHAISLPRRRDRLHVMPTSTGYEVATGPSYDWDGRKRGNTPFSVLQHTTSGVGQLRYERRSYRVGPGETMLVTIQTSRIATATRCRIQTIQAMSISSKVVPE